MKCKRVYVKTSKNFATKIECCEFYFNNVRVENNQGLLTILDKDNVLKFRRTIADIEKFLMEE